VEDEGVKRALQRASEADLKIIVLDGASADAPDDATMALIDDDCFVVLNKSDIINPGEVSAALLKLSSNVRAISVKTGDGVKGLLDDLGSEVAGRYGLQAAPGLTRLRHREALKECLASLARFFENKVDMPAELAAEDIRLAARSLGVITGRVDVESLLDIVFRDFCIGK